MASLNQDGTAPADGAATSTGSTAGLNEVAGEETASNRAISRRGEEARGGFVLRAKSDEIPTGRRRSLVERTGMKSIVQVRNMHGTFFHEKIFVALFCKRIFREK